MAKFMVLYKAAVSARERLANATPEEVQEGMKLWMDWAQKCGDAIVGLGSPLSGGKTIGSGSVMDVDSEIGGFSILEAESMDGAVKLLEDHPHLLTPGGASIEVLQFLSMPGT